MSRVIAFRVAIFNMDFIMNENFIYGKAQAGVASTC
jgi:hypothetical protein